MENESSNQDNLNEKPESKGIRGHDNWRPPYFDLLVAHYADPSDQRTLKQFCIDNSLSEDTIHQYKRYHAEVLYAAVDNVRAQYIPKIRIEAMKAVFSNIKKSFQDRKLALQLIGDLVEKTENTQVIKTPEEKRAEIAEIMTKLSHKFGTDPK